ncbi:Crp/Fnr family transcriptional regulator [Aestuariivivens marinum]|uniref:Crp/Fnr family transcriptional regulator n=1 Tax=Aestuariivivens marinum TaxID=2913555 RepID=UPI001F5A11B4|nr:Crp/Fnr family transcriptional regulator [Aestuariivivens marinum]
MLEELDLLLSQGNTIRYKKRDFIIRQGETSNKVFFVKKGVTRHYVITPEGKEKTIRISKENDFFYSSIVSYFKNMPSYIYCQCLTNCDLIYWESLKLEALFKTNSKLADFRNTQFVKFILEKHNKEIALLTKSAAERFEEFCKNNLELFNRIPHHIIASYIDITPETLSRLRSNKS